MLSEIAVLIRLDIISLIAIAESVDIYLIEYRSLCPVRSFETRNNLEIIIMIQFTLNLVVDGSRALLLLLIIVRTMVLIMLYYI